ncbi:MAG TPA: cyanophycin synthetase [bacterium]|nr:cyanophycin synthetase [bacterium]
MNISFLEDLYKRRGGIKLGLGRVAEAFPAVKRRAIPVYHVAGTNGKGTAVYALDHLLRRAGLKTGCFVSPHITDFNERILVDGTPIPDATVERLFRELERELAIFPELSFFEITFLLAWRWWEECGIERAVVEVGLGGRLDATNTIDWPKTDIITSIGLDHTQILGQTAEEIAAEKLGIVHRGDRLLLGPTIPADLAARMEQDALAAGALLVEKGPVTVPDRFMPPTQMSLSSEQQANLHLAHRAVTLTEGREIAPDFSELFIPGRFQRLHDRIILDVAHNPPAMQALVKHLAAQRLRPSLLFGAMKDKDITAMLDLIAPAVGDIFVVGLDTGGDRGASVAELTNRAAAPLRPHLRHAADAEATMAAALESLCHTHAPLLVTGSFFLLERFIGFINSPKGKEMLSHLQSGPRGLR